MGTTGPNTTCWSFSNEDQVPFPVIEGLIANSKDKITIKLELRVDTGFNGVVGLPEKAIEELQLTSCMDIPSMTNNSELRIDSAVSVPYQLLTASKDRHFHELLR